MKAKPACFVVLVTAPNRPAARKLASGLLKAKLAACVNLLPHVESHYWWQGRLEKSSEVLLVIKTVQARLKALEGFVLAHHPYETPEFLALPATSGSAKYLRWLSSSVR